MANSVIGDEPLSDLVVVPYSSGRYLYCSAEGAELRHIDCLVVTRHLDREILKE